MSNEPKKHREMPGPHIVQRIREEMGGSAERIGPECPYWDRKLPDMCRTFSMADQCKGCSRETSEPTKKSPYQAGIEAVRKGPPTSEPTESG